MRCSILLLFVAACGGSATPSDAGVDAPIDSAVLDLGGETAPDAGGCFSAGPYGTGFYDVAAPFTLPSSDGDFVFDATWDCSHSVVVIGFSPGSADSDALFHSDIGHLIYPGTRPRADYVFVASRSSSVVIPQLRARAMTALAALDPADAADWQAHLHFIDRADASALPGWVGGVFGALRVNSFAIDRFQHLRSVGSLAPATGGGFTPDLGATRFETDHFDFEHDRQARLDAEGATVVSGLSSLTTHGERWSWSDPSTPNEPVFFDATFPDAATMATFDTLEVDLGWTCTDHDETRCNQWDRLLDLYLCPDGMTGTGCGTRDEPNQVARWITSYHREGRWVTDISGMLPRFLAGGAFHFYLNTPQVDDQANPMILDLSFRLSRQGKPDKPFAIQTFAAGEHGFDPMYDASYPDVTFTPPAGATRAELVTILTGHGQDANNCAEFCDHQHVFSFNGAPAHRIEFPDPDTRPTSGCSDKVAIGTLPNQYGTWNIGRAAWCPGLDVPPLVTDVTSDLHLGASNTGHYEAQFHGAPYPGSPGGANITMASFLVYYH